MPPARADEKAGLGAEETERRVEIPIGRAHLADLARTLARQSADATRGQLATRQIRVPAQLDGRGSGSGPIAPTVPEQAPPERAPSTDESSRQEASPDAATVRVGRAPRSGVSGEVALEAAGAAEAGAARRGVEASLQQPAQFERADLERIGAVREELAEWFGSQDLSESPSAEWAAAPAPGRARPATRDRDEPSVSIRIGRIEIRPAAPRVEAARPEAPPAPPFRPKLSLSDYLEQRRAGRR